MFLNFKSRALNALKRIGGAKKAQVYATLELADAVRDVGTTLEQMRHTGHHNTRDIASELGRISRNLESRDENEEES